MFLYPAGFLVKNFIHLLSAQLMYFEVVSDISEIETIAIGGKIRKIARLREQFGKGRWRKLK